VDDENLDVRVGGDGTCGVMLLQMLGVDGESGSGEVVIEY